MTKQELEEKIKNNELVYVIYESEIYPLRLDNDFKVTKANLIDNVLGYVYLIYEIFSTKAQAQHYLDNANVTRTEKLPFVTWEEVNDGGAYHYYFTMPNCQKAELWISYDKIIVGYGYNFMEEFDLTEDGFYKAYEVCRKLFLGEEV